MRRLLKIVFVLWGNGMVLPLTAQSIQQQPIVLADPTVFLHKGEYILSGTGGKSADNGFAAYRSVDLKTWTPVANLVLNKKDVFGTKGFWAPQIFELRDTFYMAYTANEQIAFAWSNRPEGPYIQKEKEAIPAAGKQIDPFVFRDDDGKLYLYHVRLQQGNRIFVAELKDDLSGIKEETLKECLSAATDVQPWENTANATWSVAEGPTVVKKEGLYYLLYSANDFRNIDYAVGYAVAESPAGPWTKAANNPIISRHNTGKNGSGHGDLFTDKKGKLQYVFHIHQSDKEVGPRKTAIITLRFKGKGKATTIEALPDKLTFLGEAL